MMSKSKPKKYRLKVGKTGESLKSAYQKVEDGVVNGYQRMEGTVVGGYKKMEQKFVGAFLEEIEGGDGNEEK